ncbi:type II secretion system protein M [Luteolibacter flavescens]|uniref:Type II secretion system protein M n=1 Tax=Luteolibacter flavescens TaxID=1859460 RepID=A0ABT3FSD0_9BACT|nr:type II secretion system protein M [Luteolibacter flavescens]MCW1886457.1 type II secretion system protein M [Luteolibacter flavescens]
MSDREKKLVLFFGLAVFVLVNFFGISWFQSQKQKVARQLTDAKGKVTLAEATAASFDTVYGEMEWMAKMIEKSPAPKNGQLVATELEQYASNQATTHQLEIKRRAIKPNDETGIHFHRAKVEFNVSGREESLYRWLDRLQMPDQFKAVTSMRLSPDAKDDTMIDATVEVEQWYVPLVDGGSDASAEPDEEPEAEPAPNEIPGLPPVPTPTPAPAPEATNLPGTE